MPDEKSELLADVCQLVALLGHEVRTPLCIVRQGLTQLMESQSAFNAEALTLLNILDRNVDKMAQLVERCLSLMELGAQHPSSRAHQFELQSTIRRTVDTFQAERADRGKDDIDIIVDNNVPAEAYIFGDDFLFERALANLIANALQHAHNTTAPDQPVVSISLSYLPDTNCYRVAVLDNGPGISLSEQEKIFEPFYRAPAQGCPKQGSLGIGLTIVKRLVTYLAGTVSFTSSVGKGTTFYMDFPCPAAFKGTSEHDTKDESDAVCRV